MRDAQKKSIKFDAVATVPMTTTERLPTLLKANFRLGETVSKPILSLLEVIDNGAEVWLSKGDMKMFMNKDYEKGITLTRRHNTLGMEVMAFTSAKEARQFASNCTLTEDADLQDVMIEGEHSSGSGGPPEAAREQSAPAARASMGQDEALHPDSRVDDLRARLQELMQPIYGTKEILWTRLSKAEKEFKAHRDKMQELRERHERAVEEGPTVAPRVVHQPGDPSPEERAAHEVLHMTKAPWCEACVRGNQTGKPHHRLTHEQKDIGKGLILLDFAYLKTDGEWCDLGEPEPVAAELYATTLIMVDADTLMMRAVSLPTKAVGEYAIATVLDFLSSLNLERTVIKTDGEPTICALAAAVKAKRTRPTDLEHGSLKDSAGMGGVEAPIRWWQAKVRTFRYDLERRYGVRLRADEPMWCWLTRYAAWATSMYRVRADGNTSHKSAYGVGYRGEILPFGETALFKVPESHTRQVTAKVTRNKGESMFVKGIWVGKHRESDDYIFLTAGGWHRARTVRRLETQRRADTKVWAKIRAVPWEPRSARPLDEHVQVPVEMPLVASTLREEQLTKLVESQAASASAPAGGVPAPAPAASAAAPAAASSSSSPADAPRPMQAAKRPGAEPNDEPPEKRATVEDQLLQDLRSMDESEESETKRMRFAAAVSLDEPVDYKPLEGLTIDLLSKISTLSDAEELEGKRGALAMLAHYGVYKDVPADECQGMKELRARWEPQTRGSEVKWRYVAQEFKWMETRDDVFAASSTAQTSRMVDFVSIKEDGYGTFVADCVKAYYQADQLEEVCVKPPLEYLRLLEKLGKNSDVKWKLLKMLPGQRIAGAGWIATARKRLEAAGYENCQALPQFFYDRKRKVLLELHMDDIHGTGPVDQLAAAIAELRGVFDLKASDTIRVGRYSHLKRERLRMENGDVMIRPSLKYIEDLIVVMDMSDAKIVSCPSLMEDRPEDDEELSSEAAKIFRSCVGIALYVMPDRPDIQRDVQILTRNLRNPTAFDRKRLVKLVRYLKGTKTFGMLMRKPHGDKGKVLLELFSDTDFAGCKETRRAMTCGVTRLDKTVTSVFARRQGVQSTSSGEAEFYGATSVVMDGRVIKHFLEWLGYEVTYQLLLDSSAAKAMVQRDGVGKLKHMDVRALWIQAERRDHGLVTRKVPGAKTMQTWERRRIRRIASWSCATC